VPSSIDKATDASASATPPRSGRILRAGVAPAETLSSAFAPCESSLLLCCARTELDADHLAQAQALLSEPIAWPVLLELGSRHRVLPLLAKNLQQLAGTAKIPADVVARLRAFAAGNAVQALMLAHELSKLLEMLAAEGIAAAPFKGPVLAREVYGDVALRHAGDLDLLVRPADIVRAKGLFDRLGYASIYPTSTPREQRYLKGLSPAQAAGYLQSHSEHHLLRADGLVTVDLHWDLAPRDFSARVEAEQLWSWLSPRGDPPAPAFRDPELLLVLCLNGAKDAWGRLDRVCDVAELIRRRPNLDWARVMELAARLGWRRIFGLGLLLAHRLLELPMPAEIEPDVRRDDVAARLADQSIRRMFRPRAAAVEGATAAKAMYYLQVRERLSDRVRYCANQLAPTVGDRAAMPLPRGMGFVHWMLRPMRLAGRHVSAAMRNSRGATENPRKAGGKWIEITRR
jgi:hypothetical protein